MSATARPTSAAPLQSSSSSSSAQLVAAATATPSPPPPRPFIVERAADFALQQQQRIADLEQQLGLAAPATREEAAAWAVTPINIRHGCPRCSTCNTLLMTIGQLEMMLQHKDSDCDALRRSLDDAQRVNALLLEQVEMLQRGLERAISVRPVQKSSTSAYSANSPSPSVTMSVPAPNFAAMTQTAASVGGRPTQQQLFPAPPPPSSLSPPSAQIPTGVRMLDPSTDSTLRAMADAVLSLQQLWPEKPLKPSHAVLPKTPAAFPAPVRPAPAAAAAAGSSLFSDASSPSKDYEL